MPIISEDETDCALKLSVYAALGISEELVEYYRHQYGAASDRANEAGSVHCFIISSSSPVEQTPSESPAPNSEAAFKMQSTFEPSAHSQVFRMDALESQDNSGFECVGGLFLVPKGVSGPFSL
jgi:hypothetical protein